MTRPVDPPSKQRIFPVRDGSAHDPDARLGSNTDRNSAGDPTAAVLDNRAFRQAVRLAQAAISPYRTPGHSVVEELLEERKAEAEREYGAAIARPTTQGPDRRCDEAGEDRCDGDDD